MSIFRNSNQYTLVLGGGGAKGAYQIGAWRALRECHFQFKAVIGTSVGALNGAFIVHNYFKEAYQVWEQLSIDKIISIPKELVKEGKINLTKANFKHLKKIQGDFFHYMGMDTAPLKNLILKFLDEKKIRQSGIDFGIVTYQINTLKPVNIFMDQIPWGQIHNYLLGSASLPGFKSAQFDDKVLIDGGVYDNIPYNLARKRGYRKIIMIDISGPGRNKKMALEGAETIYIKNSLDLGGTIEFHPKVIRKNIKLGYLDTLRVLEKISGIHYFYHIDQRVVRKLNQLLLKKEIIDEYQEMLPLKEDQDLMTAIRKIVPKELAYHNELIIALAECAAESVGLEKIELYTFKDFIRKIWQKRAEIMSESQKIKENNGSMDLIWKSIKEKGSIFKISPYQYKILLSHFFNFNKEDALNRIYDKSIFNLFPVLQPARIFFILLKFYYQS